MEHFECQMPRPEFAVGGGYAKHSGESACVRGQLASSNTAESLCLSLLTKQNENNHNSNNSTANSNK